MPIPHVGTWDSTVHVRLGELAEQLGQDPDSLFERLDSLDVQPIARTGLRAADFIFDRATVGEKIAQAYMEAPEPPPKAPRASRSNRPGPEVPRIDKFDPTMMLPVDALATLTDLKEVNINYWLKKFNVGPVAKCLREDRGRPVFLYPRAEALRALQELRPASTRATYDPGEHVTRADMLPIFPAEWNFDLGTINAFLKIFHLQPEEFYRAPNKNKPVGLYRRTDLARAIEVVKNTRS